MTETHQKLSAGGAPEAPPEMASVPTIAVPEAEIGILSSASDPILGDHHADFAEFHEGYVRSYISLADTKAAWIFTITAGMVVFLFGSDQSSAQLFAPSMSLSYFLLVLSVGLLTVSAFFSFLVVAPRLTSFSGEGIVFFGAVARRANSDEYLQIVSHYDKSALTRARIRHTYDVSRVCDRKYASLKKSIWLGLPGLASAASYIAVR